MKTTIDFLRAAFRSGDIASSRGYTDVFADRLARSLTEPTLSRAMEQLLRAINASVEKIHPPLAAQMIAVSQSTEAPRVLAWLRQHAKLASLLAATRDETILADIIGTIELPEALAETGSSPPAGGFDVALTVRCLSQLAHGAEGKAGNATLFRRQQVLSTTGAVLSLPYYGGNAVRGQMRDLLADHFLTTLEVKPSLWFFYEIYSGGALEEANAGIKAITKRVGSDGALRTEGLKEFRDNVVMLSVLGCAFGNRVLSGRIQVSDLRPRCREWASGDAAAASLMGWEYLTRREDREDHEDNHSMIANTEVLKSGVVLDGGITLDRAMRPVERSCVGRALKLLRERGQIGAENRRGLGRVEITIEGAPDPEAYDEDLLQRKPAIVEYLKAIDAVAVEG